MPFAGRYSHHTKRTLLTLGTGLFAAVIVGLTIEVCLRGSEVLPDSENRIVEMVDLMLAIVRWSLPAIAAFVAVPILCTGFFHKLYAIASLREAHDWLNRMAFGKMKKKEVAPFVMVREGGIAAGNIVEGGEITAGEEDFAVRVGGPATLIVYNDSAVVTEQYACLKRILSPGVHSLERFEKIWEIIDLRPQHQIHLVFASTGDGIPITCEMHISFQIDDQVRDEEVHRGEGDYSYIEEAVFKAATSKCIREPEHPLHHYDWARRVVFDFAEGSVRDLLIKYPLSRLLAPPQVGHRHPKEEISQMLEDELRERVREIGAKLLAIKIGAIEVKAREDRVTDVLSRLVSSQWIETWETDWRQTLTRSTERDRLPLVDATRAQAEADIVKALAEALHVAIADGQVPGETYTTVSRFVGALLWMSHEPEVLELMPSEALEALQQLQELVASYSPQEMLNSHGEERSV